MKLIEILNLNRELLIYFQKAGIRLDDVQYIDLFNEYRTLSAQGEKVSYIVARLATEYAVSERKVYNLIIGSIVQNVVDYSLYHVLICITTSQVLLLGSL